ncbi:Na+/H+ antiporter family protein [Bacillus sp. 2205SS5-2]|uniref:Na+/H+ antiporter family protein n=1 Tax=Bacillus sp. 2205SS5-2 TaxID=3109031 RepID=UPI003007171B
MNAVIIAVLVMLLLSLFRVNVVLALIIGALVGGVTGGLSLEETVAVFSEGLGGGATIALSYALLGGFAVAISATGVPNALVEGMMKIVGKENSSRKKKLTKVLLILLVLLIAILSQNVIPIHIAFIPLLIPTLLKTMNELSLDRRLMATVLTFGLTAPYILLPVGFGFMFHEIIASNMAQSGMEIALNDIPKAMMIPTVGLIVGLLIALFISYRKPRTYREATLSNEITKEVHSKKRILFAAISIVVALVFQLLFESMIIGALSGLLLLYVSGAVPWRKADDLLTEGMKMMAFIGFVMIAANGFAAVIKATGDVESLVENTAFLIGDNKTVAALLMLIVGLVITMGIGSSFATIPIIATIFVPLAIQLGFSPLATIVIIGTAGALGDAGSPASDSTLGPTAGLNADNQHNHIWDTCVPTFLHFNLPLILFGWVGAILL